MTSPEAHRVDLYNRLVEVLGSQRADTLMAYLPIHASTELATRSGVAALETRFDRLDRRFDALEEAISSMGRRLDQRIDRLFLTLVTGLFVIVAAMAGVVFGVLG